jgi:hypothetical protein
MAPLKIFFPVPVLAEAENPLLADGLPSRNQDWSSGEVRESASLNANKAPLRSEPDSRSGENFLV